jgi:hypothetical protein
MFGSYLGRITPDDGRAVELHILLGWVEDREAPW